MFSDMCLQVMTYNVGLFMAVLVGGERLCSVIGSRFIQEKGRWLG